VTNDASVRGFLGSAPGKRKIGGDLQGEPIFRLSGPAAALNVPVRRPCVVPPACR